MEKAMLAARGREDEAESLIHQRISWRFNSGQQVLNASGPAAPLTHPLAQARLVPSPFNENAGGIAHVLKADDRRSHGVPPDGEIVEFDKQTGFVFFQNFLAALQNTQLGALYIHPQCVWLEARSVPDDLV